MKKLVETMENCISSDRKKTTKEFLIDRQLKENYN
jgi:hypothetical protein